MKRIVEGEIQVETGCAAKYEFKLPGLLAAAVL